MKRFLFFLLLFLAIFSYGQPPISLPTGYTWVLSSSSNHSSGPVYTGNASGNNASTNCCSGGATSCGSNDTSFGGAVQCSTVPWSVVGTPGVNFIQDQEFGNTGTCDNNLAGLAVVCNPGLGSTPAGTNWPSSSTETRRVTLTNWNNTQPASTILALPLASRTSGTVWLPSAGTLRFRDDGIGDGTGAGADEMRLTMIGGDNSSCASWIINATYNLDVAVSGAYGSVSGVNGMKVNQSFSQSLSNVPNAGVGNAYNATNGVNHVCCGGCQFQALANSWYFPGGINTPSIGTGFAQPYNILTSLVQDGSTFNVDFTSTQTIAIDRTGGSSGDARATMGPGMGGKVALEVAYEIWIIQAPLPVKFITFNAKKSNNNIILNWSTGSELNNEGFYIQKSNDAFNWKEISFVKGNGNSSQTISYKYNDIYPTSGINYYRLAQKDFDGQISYSDVRQVQYSAISSLKIFPNPTQGIINIDTNDLLAEYEIFSMDGKYLEYGNVNGKGSSQIDISALPSGLYTLRLISNDEILVQKVIKE